MHEKLVKKIDTIHNIAEEIEKIEANINIYAGRIPELIANEELKKAENTADMLLEMVHELRIMKHKLQFNRDELFAMKHDPKYFSIDAEDINYFD